MTRRMNRFLAIFLSVLFVLAMLPVGVLAEGAGDTDENISANDTEGGRCPCARAGRTRAGRTRTGRTGTV